MKAFTDDIFNRHVTSQAISHTLNRQHIETIFLIQVATELSLSAMHHAH